MYAIMVCFDEDEDDWIYITEDNPHCWDLKPVLFEDAKDALEFAKPWVIPGKEKNVVVVNYEG